MLVSIEKGKAFGRFTAPPSKSMAHRALICGALTEKSVISGISYSKDILATLSCLEALGARVIKNGDSVEIGGLLEKSEIKNPVFCNESGSTLRFLIPLALLKNSECTFTGSERLFSRSLEVYKKIAEKSGIDFVLNRDSLYVKGALKPYDYRVRGDISSQFISGLLFALPVLYGNSTITVTESFESKPYVDLTLSLLSYFGINIETTAFNSFNIKGNQSYKNSKYTVEGDYSNAAFFEVLNFLGSDIEISGLKEDSLQGDKIYKKYFNDIINGTDKIDISDCPDLAPILFSLAAVKGQCEFTGTARLKIKESDRATAMAEELSKFNVNLIIKENSVTVLGGALKPPTAILNGHNDHRIVMALSVLCTLTGGKIEGAEAVSKSFPDFFDRLSAVNIKVKKSEI